LTSLNPQGNKVDRGPTYSAYLSGGDIFSSKLNLFSSKLNLLTGLLGSSSGGGGASASASASASSVRTAERLTE